MTEKRVIGLIAGSGEFPIEIAQAMQGTGQKFFVLGLRGFFDRRLKQFPYASVDMLDPQSALQILRSQGVTDVILAGGVHRPGPSALLSIYSAFRNRDEIKRLLAGGDDNLLRGVIAFLEDNGFHVLGLKDVASTLLAPVGLINAIAMPDTVGPVVERALEILKDLGRYDVGQGVVVAGQRVLAIEGPEGTDMMLARVGDMQHSKRVKLGDDPAILVKIAKPDQDRRVDLPAIGPRTVRYAKSASLSGIVVAAGDVVLVERKRLISEADRCRVFIAGVNAS